MHQSIYEQQGADLFLFVCLCVQTGRSHDPVNVPVYVFQYGLGEMIDNPAGLPLLALSLDTKNTGMMIDILRLLAAVSLVPPHG